MDAILELTKIHLTLLKYQSLLEHVYTHIHARLAECCPSIPSKLGGQLLCHYTRFAKKWHEGISKALSLD